MTPSASPGIIFAKSSSVIFDTSPCLLQLKSTREASVMSLKLDQASMFPVSCSRTLHAVSAWLAEYLVSSWTSSASGSSVILFLLLSDSDLSALDAMLLVHLLVQKWKNVLISFRRPVSSFSNAQSSAIQADFLTECQFVGQEKVLYTG